MSTATQLDATNLAARLHAAVRGLTLIPPLTDEVPNLDADGAYAIQDALVARLLDDGTEPAGYKLGLTSRAKQDEMGVHEPIHGRLTRLMVLDPGEPLTVADLGQPRVEPEIGFLLARDLDGPLTMAGVLAATDAVMAVFDVLDSRYLDYRFRLPDVIADNASSGRVALGGPRVSPRGIDLAAVECTFEKNGRVVSAATGKAVMGHPAEAVAWLARSLARRGIRLRAGELVLSGSPVGALSVAAGDVLRASLGPLGTITLTCR